MIRRYRTQCNRCEADRATRASGPHVDAAESALDVEALVASALADTVMEARRFPALELAASTSHLTPGDHA